MRRDVKEVIRGLNELEKKRVPTATVQALNRAGSTVKTRTIREMREELALKNQKKLRKAIRQEKASRVRMTTAVIVKSEWFGVEDTKHAKIRTSTRKGRRRFKVTFKGKTIPNAFKSTGGGISTKPVFKPDPDLPRYRTGSRAIKRVFSYPTLQAYRYGKVDRDQEEEGAKRFRVEFDRALENQLRRLRMK